MGVKLVFECLKALQSKQKLHRTNECVNIVTMNGILRPSLENKYSVEMSELGQFIDKLTFEMAKLGCDVDIVKQDGPWVSLTVNRHDVHVGLYEENLAWGIDIPLYAEISPERLVDVIPDIVEFCRPLTDDDRFKPHTEENSDGVWGDFL